MSSIQDIHALEERIYDYVEEYLGGNYAPDDVLAISTRCGKVSLKADAKDSDGSVKSVTFYVGNALVGTASSAPYQVSVKDLEPGMHSAVAVVTDNSGLTQMSEFATFIVESSALSSSSAAHSSSSNVAESSSSVIPGSDPESSSGAVASSSSGFVSISPRTFNIATEAEAGFYRVFDLQGRPLSTSLQKPAKIPGVRVIVVEYSKMGSVKRRYIQ